MDGSSRFEIKLFGFLSRVRAKSLSTWILAIPKGTIQALRFSTFFTFFRPIHLTYQQTSAFLHTQLKHDISTHPSLCWRNIWMVPNWNMNSKWAATDWNFGIILMLLCRDLMKQIKTFSKVWIECVIACSLTKQAKKSLIVYYNALSMYCSD